MSTTQLPIGGTFDPEALRRKAEECQRRYDERQAAIEAQKDKPEHQRHLADERKFDAQIAKHERARVAAYRASEIEREKAMAKNQRYAERKAALNVRRDARIKNEWTWSDGEFFARYPGFEKDYAISSLGRVIRISPYKKDGRVGYELGAGRDKFADCFAGVKKRSLRVPNRPAYAVLFAFTDAPKDWRLILPSPKSGNVQDARLENIEWKVTT